VIPVEDEFEIVDVFDPPLVAVEVEVEGEPPYVHYTKTLWKLVHDIGGSEPLASIRVYVSPRDYWVRPIGHGAPPLVRVARCPAWSTISST